MGIKLFLFFLFFTLSFQIPLPKDKSSPSFLSKSFIAEVPTSDLFLHLVPIINFDSAGFIECSDNLYQGSSDSDICIKCIFDGLFENLNEKSPKTITLTEFSYFQRYYSTTTKEKQEKIKNLVKNGNLEFCLGGYVKLSEQMVSYENIIDQVSFISRFLLREFRYLPRSACNLGTNGHSFVYNEILSQSGYDGVFIDDIDDFEAKSRKVSKDMEFYTEYTQRLDNNSIFTHVNYLNNNETVFGDGVYQVLWTGIEGEIIQTKMKEYVEWIYQQAKFYQSRQIMHQIGGDFKFKDATSDYVIIDFLIKFLNKNYDTFKIKAGYSTPYIYMNELSKEKLEGKYNIYFESQHQAEANDFFLDKTPKIRSIGIFSNRQWLKGFIKESWLIYEGYKTYLAINLLAQYLAMSDEEKNIIFNDYEKQIGNFEKKLMVSLDDKVVSGLIQEFVARKIKADIKDVFQENFEVFLIFSKSNFFF